MSDTEVSSEVMYKGQQRLVRPISPNSPCDQELGVQSAALSADSIHAMPWKLLWQECLQHENYVLACAHRLVWPCQSRHVSCQYVP